VTVLEFGAEAPWIAHAAAATALVLHIGGGSVAMASGAVAMAAPKGERLHRAAGNVFFASMLTMATVAAIVAPMLPTEQWTNTTAATFTLYLVATAWATARRGEGEVGRFERVAMIVPLGIVALAAGVLAFGLPASKDETPSIVYAFAVICALSAACDLRAIRRGGLSGVSRIARHVWRMSAALFVATGSFFFGQAQVLPEAIRNSALPMVLGLAPLVLMAFWLVRVRSPRRGPAAA